MDMTRYQGYWSVLMASRHGGIEIIPVIVMEDINRCVWMKE